VCFISAVCVQFCCFSLTALAARTCANLCDLCFKQFPEGSLLKFIFSPRVGGGRRGTSAVLEIDDVERRTGQCDCGSLRSLLARLRSPDFKLISRLEFCDPAGKRRRRY
jgi:hypothetical protein